MQRVSSQPTVGFPWWPNPLAWPEAALAFYERKLTETPEGSAERATVLIDFARSLWHLRHRNPTATWKGLAGPWKRRSKPCAASAITMNSQELNSPLVRF